MAYEKQLLVMATLDYEMLDEYLKTNPSLLNIFGTDIRQNAQTRDEFLKAGLDHLDSSKLKAKALMVPVTIDMDRCTFVTNVHRQFVNLEKVDRGEYARLLSLRWDKDHPSV